MKYIYLFLLLLLLLLLSFHSLADTGTDCLTPNARCSAYDLEVNAEVLKSIEFYGALPLVLGQVTKGETVSMDTPPNNPFGRGRENGFLVIVYSSSDSNIIIKCLPDSSGVYFKQDELTAFNSCLLSEKLNYELFGDTIIIEPNSHEMERKFVEIYIGGEIDVPNDATDGDKSGSMRIEVIYE